MKERNPSIALLAMLAFYLIKHMYVFDHQDDKPFNCSQCDHSFVEKEELKRHLNSVHGLKETFKCPLCNHNFTKNFELNLHVSNVLFRSYKLGIN